MYPYRTRGAVTITTVDVARLREKEFLNDSLIDFYIRYLQEHAVPVPTDGPSTLVYNSFFHGKMRSLWYVRARARAVR